MELCGLILGRVLPNKKNSHSQLFWEENFQKHYACESLPSPTNTSISLLKHSPLLFMFMLNISTWPHASSPAWQTFGDNDFENLAIV